MFLFKRDKNSIISFCFLGLRQKALEVCSYHIALHHRVSTGNAGFCVCTFKVRCMGWTILREFQSKDQSVTMGVS